MFSFFLAQCDYTMGLVMALVSIAIVEAVGFPPSLWDHSSGPATPHLLSLRSGRDIEWTDLLKVLNNLRLERCTDETHGGKRKKRMRQCGPNTENVYRRKNEWAHESEVQLYRWSPDFFQASSFQLLKLENLLRWSLFTFIYNRYTNMNYFM